MIYDEYMSIYSRENIEEYIISVLKNPFSLDLCLKHHFLIKDLLKAEFENMDNDDLLYIIRILKKYNIIPNIDDLLLLEQIRDKNFVKHTRITPWKIFDIDILDSRLGKTILCCAEAKFHLINSWNITTDGRWHKIIFDKNNLDVLWADFGNNDDEMNSINKTNIFISHNNIVYSLYYAQPDLWFFLNPCKDKKLNNIDNDSLDLYINKECEETINSGHGFIPDLEFAKNCDLEKCIESKYFKNGPNWKHGKKCIMYNGKTATYIKNIYNKYNKIYIDIENNTFKINKIETIILDIDKNVVINKENNKSVIIEDYEFII
jgi:hypothetical protein